MCRVGHCYWYQEGPAATFLLAVHHRFEIFFSTCDGVRDEQPEASAAKVACNQDFGEDVVANDASSDAGGSDASGFWLWARQPKARCSTTSQTATTAKDSPWKG